ncbi:MAG: hypothetical protein ACI8XC_004569 [Gammaproteobacteria bacterium]
MTFSRQTFRVILTAIVNSRIVIPDCKRIPFSANLAGKIRCYCQRNTTTEAATTSGAISMFLL